MSVNENNPRIFSDFNVNLTTQNDGDITRNTELLSVRNSIENIFQTLQGSRRMLPSFPGPVQNVLFEPMDEETARILGDFLISAIKEWDDRVIIRGMNVAVNYSQLRYEVTLSYSIKTSPEVTTVSFIIRG